jgi:hypothetical protein
MSTALIRSSAAFEPRGLSLVQSGIHRVRVAWSTHWQRFADGVELAAAVQRARLARLSQRTRLALDPSVSRQVAAYQVGEAHAFAGAATLTDARAWSQPVDVAAGFLDQRHRRELARHFMAQGQGAHAAIAAYTRLASELLTLGAHPELLMHVHAAALERVHHAEGAFSLASAFAGVGISPSAWPELPRLARASKLTRAGALAKLAERTLLEGWLSTAFGAALAGAGSTRASDPVIATHLRMVAEDSSRQADFAIRLVEWALKLGGDEVALALTLTIRNLPRALPAPSLAAGLRPEVLERHGMVGPTLQRALYLSTRAQVVNEMAARLEASEWEREARRQLRVEAQNR